MTTPLRDERDMDDVVRTWLQEDEGPAPDRQRRIGRIMGRVDATRQRRRLWPRNPFARRAVHSAAGSDDGPDTTSPTLGAVRALTPMRAMAGAVALVIAASLLVYLVDAVPPPVLAPGAAAPATVDELVAMNQRAWADEPELLAEVYAPDGVHSATFYDRTNVYTGPDEIGTVTGFPGTPELIGPRIDIPAAEGEWRWVDFLSLGGGSICLNHAVDGRLVRHDCLVPEMSSEARPPAQVTEDPDTLAAIDEIQVRLDAAWGPGVTLDDLEAVYAPDAVHMARYLDGTRTYVGPEEILSVARYGGTMEPVGERVAFEAPEGELAWAGAKDLGGGVAVCEIRARDGMVFRQDCLLPVYR
jgi:hypothetical protein